LERDCLFSGKRWSLTNTRRTRKCWLMSRAVRLFFFRNPAIHCSLTLLAVNWTMTEGSRSVLYEGIRCVAATSVSFTSTPSAAPTSVSRSVMLSALDCGTPLISMLFTWCIAPGFASSPVVP
ncbi:hypothetical protein J6590_040861, partial [Homalodisca vitripennis]